MLVVRRAAPVIALGVGIVIADFEGGGQFLLPRRELLFVCLQLSR